MTAPQNVNAQGPSPATFDINATVTVTATKHKAVEHGKTHKYKAVEAAVSVPLASLHPKEQLKGDASLSFVEYKDSKGAEHRQVTQKNLKVASNAFESLFDTLVHATSVYSEKVKNKADKKSEAVPVAAPIQLKDKDIKVHTPKLGKSGAVTVVASIKIYPHFHAVVTQKDKGVSDLKVSSKNLAALNATLASKKKEELKEPEAVIAIINALHKKALLKLEKFNTENAGKKVDPKKVDKPEGQKKAHEPKKHEHKKHEHKHHHHKKH